MTAPNREEQARRLIYELQLMEGTAQTLQSRLQVLSQAQAELNVAKQSLETIEEAKEGSDILVPTGSGTFVHAKLGNPEKLIVNIGAEVLVDMTVDDAKENVQGRLEEVEKAITSVSQQLEQILAQMKVHQDGINRLSAQMRGEQPLV
jgi:prefoldin alpha subunit